MKKSTKVISGVLAGVAIVGGLATAGYYVAKDVKASIDNSSANVQEDVKWLEAYACDEEAGQEGSLTMNKLLFLVGQDRVLMTYGQDKDNKITCFNEYDITKFNKNAFDYFDLLAYEKGKLIKIAYDYSDIDGNTYDNLTINVVNDSFEFCDCVLTKVEIPDFIDYDGKT